MPKSFVPFVSFVVEKFLFGGILWATRKGIAEMAVHSAGKFVRRRAHSGGLAPGTLQLAADVKEEPARVTVTRYDESTHEVFEVDGGSFDWATAKGDGITWINIDGLKDLKLLRTLGDAFNIHPLALEDILNVGQRPKFETYDNFAFVVLNMLTFDPGDEVKSEQISMVLLDSLLITFQETRGDVFDPVRERIRGGKGRLRKRGADYLAYGLIDAIVDHYFFILEKIGEKVEDIEADLVTTPEAGHLRNIQHLKRELIFLRKHIWPLREMLNGMERGETPLIDASTGVFLRDVYDHCVQIIDSVESLRDIVSGMLDIYLSSLSNRMNEVMKVLTMIATIFIPLSFVAGLYGMNFEYMPELKIHYGYFGCLALMAGIAVTMLLFFRGKKWL